MRLSNESDISETVTKYPLRTYSGVVKEVVELPENKYSAKSVPVSVIIEFDYKGGPFKPFRRQMSYDFLRFALGEESSKDNINKNDCINLSLCFDGKNYHRVYSRSV